MLPLSLSSLWIPPSASDFCHISLAHQKEAKIFHSVYKSCTEKQSFVFCLNECFLIQQVPLGYWQKCVEKMEEKILCAGSGKLVQQSHTFTGFYFFGSYKSNTTNHNHKWHTIYSRLVGPADCSCLQVATFPFMKENIMSNL